MYQAFHCLLLAPILMLSIKGVTTMASQITCLAVVYSIVHSGTDQRKKIKVPRHWPLCGEFTGTGEFLAQTASNAEKKFPFDDVIMTTFRRPKRATGSVAWWSHHITIFAMWLVHKRYLNIWLMVKHNINLCYSLFDTDTTLKIQCQFTQYWYNYPTPFHIGTWYLFC